MITVRPATMVDAAALLAWRNDPETRAMCTDNRVVPCDEHVAWLTRTLAAADRRLLILEVNGRPAGTARFDYYEPTEFSFTIAPPYRRKGFSLRLALVATGMEQSFIARIRATNRSCQRLMFATGMRLVRDGELQLWSMGTAATVPVSNIPVKPVQYAPGSDHIFDRL